MKLFFFSLFFCFPHSYLHAAQPPDPFLEKVSQVLQGNGDLNKEVTFVIGDMWVCCTYCETPLLYAATDDKYHDLLHSLVDSGACLTCCTKRGGQTVLHQAAGDDAPKNLLFLIQCLKNRHPQFLLHTLNTTSKDCNSIPLFWAARNAQYEGSKKLLEAGALTNIRCPTFTNSSPLHAAMIGRYEIEKLDHISARKKIAALLCLYDADVYSCGKSDWGSCFEIANFISQESDLPQNVIEFYTSVSQLFKSIEFLRNQDEHKGKFLTLLPAELLLELSKFYLGIHAFEGDALGKP